MFDNDNTSDQVAQTVKRARIACEDSKRGLEISRGLVRESRALVAKSRALRSVSFELRMRSQEIVRNSRDIRANSTGSTPFRSTVEIAPANPE